MCLSAFVQCMQTHADMHKHAGTDIIFRADVHSLWAAAGTSPSSSCAFAKASFCSSVKNASAVCRGMLIKLHKTFNIHIHTLMTCCTHLHSLEVPSELWRCVANSHSRVAVYIHTYMYIFRHVCMYVCMPVCMYARMYDVSVNVGHAFPNPRCVCMEWHCDNAPSQCKHTYHCARVEMHIKYCVQGCVLLHVHIRSAFWSGIMLPQQAAHAQSYVACTFSTQPAAGVQHQTAHAAWKALLFLSSAC